VRGHGVLERGVNVLASPLLEPLPAGSLEEPAHRRDLARCNAKLDVPTCIDRGLPQHGGDVGSVVGCWDLA
jgi:hypothetical protein